MDDYLATPQLGRGSPAAASGGSPAISTQSNQGSPTGAFASSQGSPAGTGMPRHGSVSDIDAHPSSFRGAPAAGGQQKNQQQQQRTPSSATTVPLSASSSNLGGNGLPNINTTRSTTAFGGGGDDEEDFDKHSATGTESTGDGAEGEDDDLLLQTAIDVCKKIYNAQTRRQTGNNANSGGGDSGVQSANRSPGQSALDAHAFGESSDANGNSTGGAVLTSPHQQQQAANRIIRRNAKESISALFEAINVQSARALIIADPVNDKIVWANEAAQRLFGRLDLVGNVLEILMPAAIAEAHVAIVASYVERFHKEFKKSGQPPDTRLLNIIKERHLKVVRLYNGREREFYINAWVRTLRMKDEPHNEPSRLMCLEAFDAQKYHDDAQSARIFRAALENVSDAVVVADFDGRIEWVNKSMEQLSGYPLSMLLNQRATVNVFLHPEFVERHEGYLAHFRQSRKHAAAAMEAMSSETVVRRRTEMKASYGYEAVELRVDIAFNKLVAYMKSTKEFIPREEFESERLKLLLPAAIVKLISAADSGAEITSHSWTFDDCSVLFMDVAHFSMWAKSRSAKQVHDRMQNMFASCEQIIQSFGGELVHRFGDAVLAIFGLNGEERHHARYAIAAAVEIQQWCAQNGFSMRLGVHSGPIGAGVYGSSKGRPGFDIWGPVANTAKRFESAAPPGSVCFSRATLDKLGSRLAGELHNVLVTNRLTGVKGLDAEVDAYMLRVIGVVHSNNGSPAGDPAAAAAAAATTPPSTGLDQLAGAQVLLSERFIQAVGSIKAKYSRWKIQSEETERRLAELQRAAATR